MSHKATMPTSKFNWPRTFYGPIRSHTIQQRIINIPVCFVTIYESLDTLEYYWGHYLTRSEQRDYERKTLSETYDRIVGRLRIIRFKK